METILKLFKKGWWKMAILLAAAGLGSYLKSIEPTIADCSINQNKIDSLTARIRNEQDSIAKLVAINDSLRSKFDKIDAGIARISTKRSTAKQKSYDTLIDSSDAYLVKLLYEYLRSEEQ